MDFCNEELDRFTLSLNNFCFSGNFDTAGFEQADAYELATCWVRKRLKVVNVLRSNLSEAQSELDDLNLSKQFSTFVMNEAQRDIFLLDGGWLAVRPDLDWLKNVSKSARVRDCIVFARERGKTFLCPFTGNAAKSDRCAGIHLFIHTVNDRACIIMPDLQLEHSSSDRIWLFPKEEKIVVCGGKYDIDYVIMALHRIIKYKNQINSYLNNKNDRKIMICEESMAHIGHYTWNVISGWQDFFDHTSPSDVDFITSYDGWQLFGGVRALYPDRVVSPTELIAPNSEEHRFELMLEKNAIAVALKGNTIRKGTADRVIDYCRSNVNQGFISSVEDFREKHFPIVMLTIRVGNRSWQEQAEGYGNLIKALRERYENIGFVIDGLNVGFEISFVQMDIDSEKKIVAEITDGLDKNLFIDSVGSTVPESLVLCNMVDFFIAPIGAGLAKTRWICNKSGVVFSNSICLEDDSYDGRLYDHWRDDLVKLHYVNKDSVKNIDDGHLGQPMRANFSMDWRVLYDAAIPHLDRIAQDN